MAERTRNRTRHMVYMAMLSAIIIALQIICTFIRFGPFSITLALIPIIIGGALYGWKSGAILGFVFGLVVFISGVLGWDGGFINMMMAYNPFFTILACFLKGIGAGVVSALFYNAIAKKNSLAAVFVASAAAPIVNTGLFALFMLTLFNSWINGIANDSGASVMSLLFISWIGINFIVEFATTVVLAVGTDRIVTVVSGRRAKLDKVNKHKNED